MTDAEFVAMLAQNPTDLVQMVVYADFLESNSDLDRARFVRAEHQLRTMPGPIGEPHFALAETMRKLGQRIEKTPAGVEWMEAIAHPKIRGTTWFGESGANLAEFTARFLATGWLNYTQSSGTFQNGKWKQQGSLVLFSMNEGYAEYTGVHVAGRISGKAQNVVQSKWEWWLEPQSTTVDVPTDTNDTVYGYTHRKLNRSPDAKPKRSKTKSKPAKSPAKKSSTKRPASKAAAKKPAKPPAKTSSKKSAKSKK
jgi:uncharacterized protein (TIGR02996 family)